MRILYFDCLSGISGDMTVGALHDLGVAESVFHDAIAALGLADEIHAHFRRESRQNISGVKFDIHAHSHHADSHHADHTQGGHGHHTHGRNHREIRQLIAKSSLPPSVKNRALAIFKRIAEAEGKIHHVPSDDVGFHEVGAADSIADIVATCAGIEALGIEACEASALVEGTGWISCAHGQFPLPAPATLEILAGIPLRQVPEPYEFITPTGAAILAEFATRFGPMSEMCIVRTGYGIGTRDTSPRPNVLRAVLGDKCSPEDSENDTISQIDSNLDDATPELAGAAMEKLFAAGALDVFFTPAHMKKNRPGFVLTVLCKEEQTREMANIILTTTTAFGVRIHRTTRIKLRREIRETETPYGPVAIKLGFLGDDLVQATPEFESCRALADSLGVSVRDVYLAAWIASPPKPA
jgi:uncharacterized protein (TIGR00299 family) protein